jgi:hypothetical protein
MKTPYNVFRNAETLRAKARERMRKYVPYSLSWFLQRFQKVSLHYYRLHASRKEAIKVAGEQEVLVPVTVRKIVRSGKTRLPLLSCSSLFWKGMPLVAVLQKKVSKSLLTKAAMKIEDDQLAYDADSEASEEEGHCKLTTTRLTMGNEGGSSTGKCGRQGAQAESQHLSHGHRVQRRTSLSKYFFRQGTTCGN